MIGTDTTSSAEGGSGTEVRADAVSTIFGIDDADEIESAAAVNFSLLFSTDDASGKQCGVKISMRRPLDSKLCIAKPLKVIKI